MVDHQALTDMAMLAASHALQLRTSTSIPRLAIWCHHTRTEPTPAMYEPKFYIVLQGRKRMAIGGQQLDFAAGRHAVSAVGLPFTGQVIEASPEKPYVGIEIALDPTIIAGLLFGMPDSDEVKVPAIAWAEIADELSDALARLLRLLERPADIPVLAPQCERELYYRLLQGPTGGTLRLIVRQNSRFHQIRKAVEWICGNADKPMCVSELAAFVGMSVTSFHRHFKAVTANTPLAYQRNIRLLSARELISSGATNVTSAAFATGYASSSQFSREYKRMFGVPPTQDVHALR